MEESCPSCRTRNAWQAGRSQAGHGESFWMLPFFLSDFSGKCWIARGYLSQIMMILNDLKMLRVSVFPTSGHKSNYHELLLWSWFALVSLYPNNIICVGLDTSCCSSGTNASTLCGFGSGANLFRATRAVYPRTCWSLSPWATDGLCHLAPNDLWCVTICLQSMAYGVCRHFISSIVYYLISQIPSPFTAFHLLRCSGKGAFWVSFPMVLCLARGT